MTAALIVHTTLALYVFREYMTFILRVIAWPLGMVQTVTSRCVPQMLKGQQQMPADRTAKRSLRLQVFFFSLGRCPSEKLHGRAA